MSTVPGKWTIKKKFEIFICISNLFISFPLYFQSVLHITFKYSHQRGPSIKKDQCKSPLDPLQTLPLLQSHIKPLNNYFLYNSHFELSLEWVLIAYKLQPFLVIYVVFVCWTFFVVLFTWKEHNGMYNSRPSSFVLKVSLSCNNLLFISYAFLYSGNTYPVSTFISGFSRTECFDIYTSLVTAFNEVNDVRI